MNKTQMKKTTKIFTTEISFYFNIDTIFNISNAILFRNLEFEDSVVTRHFWTRNKHISESGTQYTVRHTLQLPHAEIPQIKSK